LQGSKFKAKKERGREVGKEKRRKRRRETETEKGNKKEKASHILKTLLKHVSN
jgi:hypothetical protein